jgi:hypothetical protein
MERGSSDVGCSFEDWLGLTLDWDAQQLAKPILVLALWRRRADSRYRNSDLTASCPLASGRPEARC